MAVALAAIATLALPAQSKREAQVRPHEAQLIDQRGHIFTLSQLRETPLVVTFISAHCKDICPLINAQTASTVRDAQDLHLGVRFLTITLDPEHDSPADMRKIAKIFGADPRWWIVAGGSRNDVHAIMQAFHVTAQQGREGYADVHTTFVYLVDKHGVIRKTMLASNDLDHQVIAAVRTNWGTLTQ